ncbi:DNase I-like protein [Backusella circina FSU 941]|nr:DNase I-like protein [Backusella circina FSU 941]
METNRDAYIRHDPTKENLWVKTILESVKGGDKEYFKVASYQLVTMLLIVIAKREHQDHIFEVQKTYAGVGLMNVLGNKGGVAVRFRFHDSYLCFVTSHLAAFTDKTERRNQDFTELSKRLMFEHNYTEKTSYVSYSWNDGGDEGVTFLENLNVIRDWRTNASIFHNDYLIWCGDLNYRINLSESVIKSRLRQNKLDLLSEYDQLTIERSAGRTFPMFEEGDISFDPTYKYDAGTDRYDTSEKRRAPAWTDRILWKKEKLEAKHPLQLLSYQNCKKMMLSDHKPVQAIMAIDIRSINRPLQIKTLTELHKQLDENQDQQPYGEISSSYVDFGQVQFMEYKEKTLVLKNTGHVLTYFRFIPKLDETTIAPAWLTVSPLSGVIAPGEKVILRFELTVDPTNATALNMGEESLEDVLILHLENSRDFFISINGTYQRTCFGLPLETLADISVPISSTAALNIIRKSAASAAANAVNQQAEEQQPTDLNQIDLPKPLWKLMNFLWNENMFKIECLFLEHGDINVASYIRKCLDNGEPFDTSILLGDNQEEELDSPIAIINQDDDEEDDNEKPQSKEAKSSNAMVDVLIAFLDCLPEPVITTDLYERALEAAESPQMMNYVKDNLDMFHRNVLLYIGMFLRQAIDHAPASCKAKREAMIVENFTVLLRPPLDFKERNPVAAKEKREKFISQLLKTLV